MGNRAGRASAPNKLRQRCLVQTSTSGRCFARSLTQLLADRTIWINYAPDPGNLVGRTDKLTHKEIGIAEASYRWGRWQVLATLIHELTHSNGAPGKGSKAAEEALLHCGLGKRSERTSNKDDPRTPFDPSAEG
jgi:hypothetical protein